MPTGVHEATPSHVDRHRLIGLGAVAGAAVCFSISSTIVKWGQTPGSVVALWRMVGAIVVWWGVIAVQRRRRVIELPSGATWWRALPPRSTWWRALPPRSTWWRVLPSGLLFGTNIAIFFTAVTRTSIAHAEFIGALTPLLLLPAGAVLFGEHPDWQALRWGALTIAGVVLVIVGGTDQGVATLGGDLLVVVAVTTWTAYLLTSKHARQGLGVVEFMACVMPIGLLTSGPIALVLAGDEIWPLTMRGWISVVLLVLLTGIAAHGLIVFAQHSVPVASIGVIQAGQPALAVFWAWLILGETVSAVQIPGMVLVVVGLALFTRASGRASPEPAREGP
jgi:drug/metabolite transporter (DMT)-like permease